MKLIVCLLVLGLQNPIPSSGEKSQPAQNQTKSEQAHPQPTNAPPNIAPTVANHSAPAGQQRRNNATTKGDYSAPQDGWGTPVILVGIFTACVGIAQFVMYLLQWRMMRASLRHSASASRLAIRQARKSSDESIEHARQSSERGLRAYVGATDVGENGEPVKDFVDDLEKSSYSVYIKNSGQTPAYKVQTFFGWRHLEGPDKHWPEHLPFPDLLLVKERGPRGSSATMNSGQVIWAEHRLEPHEDGILFQQIHYDLMVQRKITLFFFSKVVYYDIFNREHFTNFCRVSRFARDGAIHFIVYDRYNEAD